MSVLGNHSFSYRILTGPYTGAFNIGITISTQTGPVTMTRTIAVQPTFFDMYGQYIFLAGVILIVAITSGNGR